MKIWVIGAFHELFITGSYTQIKLSKNRVVSFKIPLFMIGLSCTCHSIFLNIAFSQASFI